MGKWLYYCENIKTGEKLWLHERCKGWRVLYREPYYYRQAGLS